MCVQKQGQLRGGFQNITRGCTPLGAHIGRPGGTWLIALGYYDGERRPSRAFWPPTRGDPCGANWEHSPSAHSPLSWVTECPHSLELTHLTRSSSGEPRRIIRNQASAGARCHGAAIAVRSDLWGVQIVALILTPRRVTNATSPTPSMHGRT